MASKPKSKSSSKSKKPAIKAKAKSGKKAPKIASARRAALEKENLISQPDFLSLLRTVKNRQREMDESRGSMGNAVKLASDKKYLDKTAFGIFRRLDRMSDAKLAITVRHLMHYMDIGGIEDRATRQLDAMDTIDPVSPKPKRERKKKTEASDDTTVVDPPPAQMDLAERGDLPLQ